jgi:type I restriction-modification system DNA methylase subunit
MPLAVIELKGTDTTDLDKVTNQGFGYKNNHKECVYVVISNFEKLRFFIHHAVDYIEFNLFTLSKEDFTTLWLCLHSDNLLDNIPAKIKAESVVKEEDITKNLYKDYSSFKQELWQSIVSLNPEGDPLMFYKKTQKLIDRFLFIFFAEDAGLLPPNSISRMVERWQMLKDEDAYKPLYDIFKQYFGYINTGRPGKTPQDEIFAYNGGLMLEDDVLESITISDDVLLKHVSRLTTYDFSSEVDVNILGHIFENSLNDIEAVTAELEGQEIDKSKTKRKKDGVFYTPKYITKYIVDNTVGKLCDEKKVELNIIDEEYAKGRTNRKKETLKQLDEILQAYRNWLLKITICDPACGSGAFLNQALEYLMEEHRYIDELESQLLGAGFTFPGVENHILENNIFGVDINDESIEIAKLSLWLRTAQRGRKLTSLNNNIKCGNSLIDDPEVAGEKAFNWQQEFPTVFEKGGFDVVIGNPPYVNIEKLDFNEKKYLFENYFSAQGRTDLYVLFVEKSIKILKSKGLQGLIIPYSFINQNYAKSIRERIIQENQLISIVDTSNYFVFADAIVKTIILFIGKTQTHERTKIFRSISPEILEDNFHEISQNEFKKLNKFVFETKPFLNLLKIKFKSETNVYKLEDLCLVAYGVRVNHKTEKDKPKNYYVHTENIDNYKRFIEGKDIDRYSHNQTAWLHYQPNEHYNSMFPELFENEKLFFINVVSERIRFSYDSKNLYNSHTVINCVKIDKLTSSSHISARKIIKNKNLKEIENYNIKYILTILNSNLLNWYFLNFLSEGLHFYPDDAKCLPIKKLESYSQQPFIDKADVMIQLNKDLQEQTQKFISLLKSDFQLEKPSKKIEDFYLLDWSDFNKELQKNKIVLVGEIRDDWHVRFERYKKQALELKSQIDQTDKEIDRMVYELYGLTEEEIQIISDATA